jgi:hypothetical protein
MRHTRPLADAGRQRVGVSVQASLLLDCALNLELLLERA